MTGAPIDSGKTDPEDANVKKWVLRIAMTFVVLVIAGFWQLFFSSRPVLTTDPAVLAGDGSSIDYCELPVLDGSRKTAVEIPKANTPGCAYDHFPLPILAQCTEPLAEGAVDIRGLWMAIEGKGVNPRIGHVERIEQCGARTVVTSSGIIHDKGPNSTAGVNSNDTEGTVLFTIGDKEYCPRTSANVYWNNGVLDFRVFGWGPVVVKRYLHAGPDGEQLVWEYANGSVTYMDRICTLPEEKKIPKKRGPRLKLF